MAKTLEAKKTPVRNSISMQEPELFAQVRQVFEKRGGPPMALALMMRIALDEWLKAQK